METSTAPILSTPAEHILEIPETTAVPPPELRLTNEQLYVQYEIQRTVAEIRSGKWKRIALQFPDDMLIDAPRVFERLRDDLKAERRVQTSAQSATVTDAVNNLTIENEVDETLCILADTSYGACCVDEVAAEHVDADVIVHYGRSCLSPTARLPVIYIFTSKTVDIPTVVESFAKIYPSPDEKVCLVADIPYHHQLPTIHRALQDRGYSNIYQTEIVRDPSSPLPNRTVPEEVTRDPTLLNAYSIFHLSTPPTSLLLILSSRVKSIHVFPTDQPIPTAVEATATQLLRRRYALLTRLSTVPIFGILINTLSVKNYMTALAHCQSLISAAGKKSYVFVVGKVNAAKIANFSEIGGWVVIGCWESSLMDSGEFYRPVITPFELEVALMKDGERVWGGEWVADFGALLGKGVKEGLGAKSNEENEDEARAGAGGGNWVEEESDDEPPEFDLRTGRYVSQSRPMGRVKARVSVKENGEEGATPASSALIQMAKGEIASINGQVSPAAEFLRSKRTWQGLGSDYEIAYERDDEGKIRGAAMEEGRSGVAKGYTVGEDVGKH